MDHTEACILYDHVIAKLPNERWWVVYVFLLNLFSGMTDGGQMISSICFLINFVLKYENGWVIFVQMR